MGHRGIALVERISRNPNSIEKFRDKTNLAAIGVKNLDAPHAPGRLLDPNPSAGNLLHAP
jgi:hypothetical protein